jgi:hypothetical protein
MEGMVVETILGLVLSALWALLFYQYRCNVKAIDELEKQVTKNCEKIKRLEELKQKIWSEEKLSMLISNTIENSFAKFEMKLLNEGRLIPLKEKR